MAVSDHVEARWVSLRSTHPTRWSQHVSKRHCERSEAIHLFLFVATMDCFVASAPRNDASVTRRMGRALAKPIILPRVLAASRQKSPRDPKHRLPLNSS